jgi:hypothetical protein
MGRKTIVEIRESDVAAIVPRCKFCGCTEDAPCMTDRVPCEWAILGGRSQYSRPGTGVIDPADNVCSNPECVEKAYQEAILKCEG